MNLLESKLGEEVFGPEYWEHVAFQARANAPTVGKSDPDWEQAIYRAVDAYFERNDGEELGLLFQLIRYPVSIEEFIFGQRYLNKGREEIYPAVLEELKTINNNGGMRIINPWTEAVFTGGIGSAKSTTALYTVAYQLYVMSCFRNPHDTFGLDRATEILFAFQSVSGGIARSVDYDRFYEMITSSVYFRTDFKFNTRIKSELQFPHRIQVKAIGADSGTLGQNVVGGLLDELNFMAIVQKSMREQDGGVYDQAEKVYNSISRRRKSRFISQGRMPGILCLVSSKRYPGEFTDRKLAEAREDPTIYVYDKRVWEIKPPGTFCGDNFKLFTGDLQNKARVLAHDEPLGNLDPGLIMDIPVEYRGDFDKDLVGAIRDIAGVSVYARFPFFSYTDAVAASFGKNQNVFNLEETDMMTGPKLTFYPDRFPKEFKGKRRWVHLDLGVSSDSAGITCGYVKRFVDTEDGLKMPEIGIDFILRVKPPRNGEIQFFKLRQYLLLLKEHGLPIAWVSFDTFQSVDSVQILRQYGFSTGIISLDKTPLPYAITKTAMYQGRVLAPKHAVCQRELLSLEQDAKTGKIDHPPQGSKDCADSLAGVVYGLTTRKEIWAEHNVPIHGMLRYVKQVETKEGEDRGENPDGDINKWWRSGK